MLKIIIRYFTDLNYRFLINANVRHKYDAMSDDDFLMKKYEASMIRKISIDEPNSFNEKLQWLKLHDRKDIYTTMVDKYLVKEYVANMIGGEYIIPNLGVWDTPEEIDFSKLPKQFVLKCNHNSGLGMCICRDKDKLNISKVKRLLHKGLKQDYYLTGREWPYKNVERKIIAEQFMSDETGELIDYKVHNFNGVPKFILVCKDRFKKSGLTEDFYTTDWELMPVKRPNIPQSLIKMPKPDELEEILDLAAKLSKGIPFVRTDFYIVNHKVYFSELTFFPASGFQPYEPVEWDNIFGSWLELPR